MKKTFNLEGKIYETTEEIYNLLVSLKTYPALLLAIIKIEQENGKITEYKTVTTN